MPKEARICAHVREEALHLGAHAVKARAVCFDAQCAAYVTDVCAHAYDFSKKIAEL